MLRIDQKIKESTRLLEKFVRESAEPVLAFGAGRESCTIVSLLRMGLNEKNFQKIRVVISDTNSRGMAIAQTKLMKLIGFAKVEIGPGVDEHSGDAVSVGIFKVMKDGFMKHKGISYTKDDTLNLNTNWAHALVDCEDIIIGMRRDDRPPRDDIVQMLGVEAYGTLGDKTKHILFPLADWISDDLDYYLGLGVENRMKVMV